MAATIHNDAFIASACQQAKKFWDAYHALKDMQDQWTALDYTNTLFDSADGPKAADVLAVVFTTTNAVATLMGQGHATNISKLL